MSKSLECNWPETYLHVTDALMKDISRHSRRNTISKIKQALQDQLDKNTTRTMTFTEDGLKLAIKIINEMEINDKN